MNKVLEIGYPIEYEDDKHIIRTGLWLKEYEVELLEKKLKELKQLKKQKEELKEIIKEAINRLELSALNKGLCTVPETDTIQMLLLILKDKMNKLEGKDN